MKTDKIETPSSVKIPKEMHKEIHNEFTKLIKSYLEYLELERNVSPLTIRNYRLYLSKFCQWIWEKLKIGNPAGINKDVIRQYRLYLSRRTDKNNLTLKRITQSYYLIALRSFLKWMIINDYKVMAPEKIELPKSESRSLKFLGNSDLERLLNQPKISILRGLRDKAILEVLFSTGLRVSELTKLDRDKVNFATKEFGVIGKGGRARVVFLSQRAVYWLEKYLKLRKDSWKPLFIRHNFSVKQPFILSASEAEKMRLNVRSVQRLVDKYARQAKLPVKISPHGLRHSFATDLLSHGADIRSVQEMLGHKNIATTQIYTHVTNKQLKDVHEKFHSGNK